MHVPEEPHSTAGPQPAIVDDVVEDDVEVDEDEDVVVEEVVVVVVPFRHTFR